MSKGDLQRHKAYLEEKISKLEKYERQLGAVLYGLPGNLAAFEEHHSQQAFNFYLLRSLEFNDAATPAEIADSLIQFVNWSQSRPKE